MVDGRVSALTLYWVRVASHLERARERKERTVATDGLFYRIIVPTDFYTCAEEA